MPLTKTIEFDALIVLKHAEKEVKTKTQRSRDLQPMGPQYRVIRKTRWNNKRIKTSYTKSHPENGGKRKANTLTSKEARIFATDIYADPGTKKAAERRIETAT
jgi:kynurenine formamidase